MTDITPPPELVEKWASDSPIQANDENWAYELYIAHQAARYGADQELEACCKWLILDGWFGCNHDAIRGLRAARRPKPPSLKEQALDALRLIPIDPENSIDYSGLDTIRRALEALDD